MWDSAPVEEALPSTSWWRWLLHPNESKPARSKEFCGASTIGPKMSKERLGFWDILHQCQSYRAMGHDTLKGLWWADVVQVYRTSFELWWAFWALVSRCRRERLRPPSGQLGATCKRQLPPLAAEWVWRLPHRDPVLNQHNLASRLSILNCLEPSSWKRLKTVWSCLIWLYYCMLY